MNTRWLILAVALASTTSGCFDAHTNVADSGPRPDAPGGDAGACTMPVTRPSTVSSIACAVTPGGEGSVAIVSSVSACCSGPTITPTLRSVPGGFEVDLAWTLCSCCDECRCAGPSEETVVPLGALAPGTYTVRSGDQSCSLTVAAPAMCRQGNSDETRYASVLFDDQPFVASAYSWVGQGCGCQPRLAPDPSHPDLHLELCDCCDSCECLDPGYEAGFIGEILPIGRHEVVIPHGVGSVRVASRTECHPIDATNLRVPNHDPSFRVAEPRITWAEVTAVAMTCCTNPELAIDRSVGPDGEIVLQAYDCAPGELCDCAVLTPHEGTGWHSLHDVAPGHYRISASGFARDIDVP